MWLNLEAGCERSLRRHDKLKSFDKAASGPGRPRRRALVVEAAHTLLPEAGLEDLPHLAQIELRHGLTGRLRAQIAASQSDDPQLAALRDLLVTQVGGSADTVGALTLVDRVYLGRLMQGAVPPIITAQCVRWYGYWRSANNGPSAAMANAVQGLAESWLNNPDQRSVINERIIAEARAVVGDDPPELVDQAV